ncbi:tetratricopeptide repeat protein [Acidovorax sp. LjRoot118]|uniref:tetratricopeptide repeat protein n=1 Tax=Acidovorax sp. LjRoot118 TaxID=3342256 RepID=UPI003ED04397
MSTKLTSLLQQAAAKLSENDYGASIQFYKDALALAPGNAGASMGMAMVLNRVGKADEALVLLNSLWPSAQKARGAPGKQFRAAVLAQMGVAYQLRGHMDQALASYCQAQKYSDSPDLQQRIEHLQAVVNQPDPAQRLLIHGSHMQASGRMEDARRAYSDAVKLAPDSVEALRSLGNLMSQQGSLDEALPLLQKALVLAPDSPELYNELGMLFQRRGDLTKAVSFHKRALKIDPGFVSAFINLGVAYKRKGDNESAIGAYRSAMAIRPNSPEAHNNLGNLLRVEGDLDGARMHLERALAIRPGYEDAQRNLDDLAAIGLHSMHL